MKKSVLLVCAFVLAVCFWLLLHRKVEAPVNSSAQTMVVATNQNSAAAPNSVVSARVPSVPPPSVITPNTRPTNAQNAVLPTVKELLQKPIEFYGKVIDENSNAISGASIGFRWDDLTAPDWTRTSTTTSDSDGLFSLNGKRGATLVVSVNKEGYYTSRKDTDSFYFVFAPNNQVYSPDAQNPVVFQLRKKGIGAALIENSFPPVFTQIWQLHHDGTPIELDLLNGSQNVVGSGQLKLEFWRDLSNRNAKKYDWKLQISISGGGLVSTDDEFAFTAPNTGYQPSIVIDMPATNQPWIGTLRTKYYIQLSNGKYGRFDFYLMSDNGVFTVHSAINPTGSRNLEPP
jgi:hypothetical protein